MGCGRIGAGFNWPPAPYLYDHCSAYQALPERVSLDWVFDKDPACARAAGEKFDVWNGTGPDWQFQLDATLRYYPVDLVSICTQPEDRADLIGILSQHRCIRAAWIEKPLAVREWPPDWKVNVNYIRRFDPRHILFEGRVRELWVWARKDATTACHFTDLARFWAVPRAAFHYFAMDGPNSYVAVVDSGAAEFFPLGGLSAGSRFMTNALGNLLDALEGTAALVSPPENALLSETWAAEILADHAASLASGASPVIP